ncbi:MAG TPA: hypothetical protein VML96_03615 [Egibacteraceae bacterium]|nr:hypothetical protein [Egibacteraceae bacterium]
MRSRIQRRGGRATQRGSAALLTVLAGAALMLLGVALILALADYGVTAARASTAADGAALAAMSMSPLVEGSGDPHAAAAQVAAANGATLRRLDVDGWPFNVEVEVVAIPATRLVRLAAPAVAARAAAAARPREAGGDVR